MRRLGATPVNILGEPDLLGVARRDGIPDLSDTLWNRWDHAEWAALDWGFGVSQAFVNGRLNFATPAELFQVQANNRWGFPDETPAGAPISDQYVARYATAAQRYFWEFLPVWEIKYGVTLPNYPHIPPVDPAATYPTLPKPLPGYPPAPLPPLPPTTPPPVTYPPGQIPPITQPPPVYDPVPKPPKPPDPDPTLPPLAIPGGIPTTALAIGAGALLLLFVVSRD